MGPCHGESFHALQSSLGVAANELVARVLNDLSTLWARAMTRLAAVVRLLHDREPFPSMVMVDAQTVKGGRYGSTFHQADGRGGRTLLWCPQGVSSTLPLSEDDSLAWYVA